jgi:HEAT repeat protein
VVEAAQALIDIKSVAKDDRINISNLNNLKNGSINEVASYLNSPLYWIRSHSVHALGNINNDDSASYIIEALNDQHHTVKWHAILALGKIGNKNTINLLNEYLIKDSSNVMVVNAINAIKNSVKTTSELVKIWRTDMEDIK